MASQYLIKRFKEYIKVKDPDDAHAVLSASGAERWMNCPGSIRLSDGIKSVDNEYSIAGTNAHTLLQFILENEHWGDMLGTKEATAFKKHIDFSKEQLASVMVAVDYILKEHKRLNKLSGGKALLHTEKKVFLKGVGFGTSDVIIYQPFGVLHVMDYKNGQSAVEVIQNLQMGYYGHAEADFYGWDFRELWMTVIQPNAVHKAGPIRTWRASPKELEEMGSALRRGAHVTTKKNAPLVKGKWCWFCPAREKKCPLQMKEKETKIMERFRRHD